MREWSTGTQESIMAITRYLSERDDFPQPTASARTVKDAALDESDEGHAEEAASVASELQQLLDTYDFDADERGAIRDAIKLLGRLSSRVEESLSPSTLRTRRWAHELLEGRPPPWPRRQNPGAMGEVALGLSETRAPASPFLPARCRAVLPGGAGSGVPRCWVCTSRGLQATPVMARGTREARRRLLARRRRFFPQRAAWGSLGQRR
jgi:hypothetical protein